MLEWYIHWERVDNPMEPTAISEVKHFRTIPYLSSDRYVEAVRLLDSFVLTLPLETLYESIDDVFSKRWDPDLVAVSLRERAYRDL